jgi:tripartite-type tricarboxylate transporter receptor subunit TctC
MQELTQTQAIDIVGRLIADWFQKRLGQPFVVENRTGAGGLIVLVGVGAVGRHYHQRSVRR